MLTEAQKKAYVDDPNNCPYCGSEDIEAGTIQSDDIINCDITCLACGKIWAEEYKVSKIYDTDELYPEDECE